MSQTDPKPRRVRLVHRIGVALCVGAAALGVSGADARARHHHHAASAKTPVLVELFTAQGCATCQPADAVLADLAKRKDVLALTFSVDIWDFLGWPDTFAQPAFTARQRAYVKRLRLHEMSTPQMVVQGAVHSPGLDKDEVDGLIDAAARSKTPTVTITKGARRVTIGAGPVGAADVWLVRYDAKTLSVSIKTGESRGKSVTETNVVRQLVRLGSWSGRARSFALPPYNPVATPTATASANTPSATASPEALKVAVLLQAAHGGKVFAVGCD